MNQFMDTAMCTVQTQEHASLPEEIYIFTHFLHFFFQFFIKKTRKALR